MTSKQNFLLFILIFKKISNVWLEKILKENIILENYDLSRIKKFPIGFVQFRTLSLSSILEDLIYVNIEFELQSVEKDKDFFL